MADMTQSRTKPHPNAEQLAAIDRFAADHGRFWKRELRNAWVTGRDLKHPDGALLRQVRNRFGPSWLETYKPATVAKTS